MTEVNFISYPSNALQGDLVVPGDKSISHRAVMLGSIAEGTTIVNGFLEGEDCIATLRIFKAMGVLIDGPVNHRLIIHGVGKQGLSQPVFPLNCGNSGTTMRLMTGLLAGQAFDSELTGDESLMRRPMERVAKPLSLMGADITTTEGKPPILIQGGHEINGIEYTLPEASAQVKSCLLLAGLYAKGETCIMESSVTRDHTERMLISFSYPLYKAEKTLIINSESKLLGTNITVPGDLSSAAFFIVAATIIPGSELIIRNVGVNPSRTGIIQILERMGAHIRLTNRRLFGEEPVADIHVKYAALEGIDIPLSLVPLAIDEFPILFIAAACAKGQTLLHGARELRFKESDRLGVMVEGLQKLGIEAQAFEDGLYIQGGNFQGGEVNSYGDHRIAMSFAIAGAVAQGAVIIHDCKNVATSFPQFAELANQIGMEIREN